MQRGAQQVGDMWQPQHAAHRQLHRQRGPRVPRSTNHAAPSTSMDRAPRGSAGSKSPRLMPGRLTQDLLAEDARPGSDKEVGPAWDTQGQPQRGGSSRAPAEQGGKGVDSWVPVSSGPGSQEEEDLTSPDATRADLFRGEVPVVVRDLYNFPTLYDMAFSQRDYSREADFLFEVYEQVNEAEPKKFLELGCGPMRHGIELASSGCHVVGVDSSSSMLEHAREQVDSELEGSHAERVTLLQQDMRTFKVDEEAKADVAYCLHGTFSHMLEHADALAMLKSCHQALKPDGLLVIEDINPDFMFDGRQLDGCDHWRVDFDGASVAVTWGEEGDSFNSLTQVCTRTITVDANITDPDLLPPKLAAHKSTCFQVLSQKEERWYPLQELRLLAALAGFKLVGVYGSLDLSMSLATSEADLDRSGRAVRAVSQRVAKAAGRTDEAQAGSSGEAGCDLELDTEVSESKTVGVEAVATSLGIDTDNWDESEEDEGAEVEEGEPGEMQKWVEGMEGEEEDD